MKITELVDDVAHRFISKGDSYTLEDLYEAVRTEAESGVDDDLLDNAVWSAVRRRDKSARKGSSQLSFGAFSFPEVLVTGDTQRQPAPLAVLRDVLSDAERKESNYLNVSSAMQELRKRNLEVLSYLQEGMTVEQSIDAWQKDQA